MRSLWRAARHQNRIFWRTPVAAFFTLVFPILMLVLFTAIFGNDAFDTVYGQVNSSQFYTPGLAVFAAASSTYTGIGINLASRRELGILKRVRGTPMPRWTYLGGVVVSAVWIAALGVTAMVVLGVVAYGVNVEAAKVPAMLLSFAVGSASFAALGLALASVARSVSMAVPIANATLLPMAFISNIFRPVRQRDPRLAGADRRHLPPQAFRAGLRRGHEPAVGGSGRRVAPARRAGALAGSSCRGGRVAVQLGPARGLRSGVAAARPTGACLASTDGPLRRVRAVRRERSRVRP